MNKMCSLLVITLIYFETISFILTCSKIIRDSHKYTDYFLLNPPKILIMAKLSIGRWNVEVVCIRFE